MENQRERFRTSTERWGDIADCERNKEESFFWFWFLIEERRGKTEKIEREGICGCREDV